MADDFDFTSLLASWPYEPGRVNARRIAGADGSPKLQIRVDLGILQMEVTGRPDGARPNGFDSLLELHLNRLERYTRQTRSSAGFVLSKDECKQLREEAVQFYHRYVGLFALGDYDGVVRDTAHNVRLLNLCREYAASEADRHVLEPFRGPVITMRSRGEAELALRAGQPKQALAALDRGLQELRAAFDEMGRGEDFDSSNEAQLLRGMRDALVPKLPASQKVELQERLRAAIDSENYELAAILRDELRMMGE